MAEVNWQDDESVVRAAVPDAGRHWKDRGWVSWHHARATSPTVVAFEKANRPAEVGRPKLTLLAVMPGGEKLWGYLVSSADAYMDKLEAERDALRKELEAKNGANV